MFDARDYPSRRFLAGPRAMSALGPRVKPSRFVSNDPVAGLFVRRLDCLNVGKTPAQSRDDDQNDGDRTEISGLLSSRRMRPHCSDHLELALKHFRIISSSPYSHGCSASEQN